MSAADVTGDTIRYTVKEILAEIRDGIASIKSVSDIHELRLSRIEQTVNEHAKQLERSAPQIDQLNQIIKTQADVKEALEAQSANVQRRSDSAFNRRDKILTAVFGFGLIVLNVLSLGPDLFHSFHGP